MQVPFLFPLFFIFLVFNRREKGSGARILQYPAYEPPKVASFIIIAVVIMSTMIQQQQQQQ